MIPNGWWTLHNSITKSLALALSCPALCSGKALPTKTLAESLTPEAYLRDSGQSQPPTNYLFELWDLITAWKLFSKWSLRFYPGLHLPILTLPVLFLKYQPSYCSLACLKFSLSPVWEEKRSKQLSLIYKDPAWHDSSFLPHLLPLCLTPSIVSQALELQRTLMP